MLEGDDGECVFCGIGICKTTTSEWYSFMLDDEEQFVCDNCYPKLKLQKRIKEEVKNV